MTAESRSPIRDRATGFVEFLLGIAQHDDRAALAALRRSLQEPTGIAMSACPYVVPFLPAEADRFVERTYFLVGALFALHPDNEPGVSLGLAFRRINDDTAEGTRARFVALLDAHPDDIAEHVRHAVSLARARAIPLDWVRTLKDLLAWRAPDRWVQRKLAGDFWRTNSDEQPPATSDGLVNRESENVQ